MLSPASPTPSPARSAAEEEPPAQTVDEILGYEPEDAPVASGLAHFVLLGNDPDLDDATDAAAGGLHLPPPRFAVGIAARTLHGRGLELCDTIPATMYLPPSSFMPPTRYHCIPGGLRGAGLCAARRCLASDS